MAAAHFDESLVRKVFRAIDKSGRGGITAPELCQVMKRIGEDVTDADARTIVSQADTKGTGMITEEDFINYMRLRSTDFNQLLRETFQAMDSKNSGFITPSQLRAGFAKAGMKLTEPELKQMLSVVDKDSSGRISWEGEAAGTELQLEFLKVTQ